MDHHKLALQRCMVQYYYEVVAWCPIASVRVCVHVCVCACMHACLHVCTHTVCICIHVCVCAFVHVCARTYARMYVCMYASNCTSNRHSWPATDCVTFL